jgi:dipeptidyl aminopeptidase/acylaminoacyl peptidase
MTVAPETGTLTIEHLLRLKRPAEVELSPTGNQIAFVVSPAAKERGKGLETRLWLGDIDGEIAPIGVVGAAEGLPRFSPNGCELAFSSDEGHPGRMSLRLHGRGEIGSIPGSMEDVRWSPDGRALLVLAADLGSDRAGVQNATKIHEEGAREDDPRVLRPARYWRRLFLIDAESGETREVTPEGTNVFEFDWAGGKVAAVCTNEPSEGAWYDAWLGLIDPNRRTVECVHTPKWHLQCPRISPRGTVGWIEGLASDRASLTGTVHVQGVGPLAPELDVTWIAFADEETIWYAGRRRSGTFAGRLRLDGNSEELCGGELLLGGRRQPRIAPSQDGTRVAAVVEGAEEPPEVVEIGNGYRRALTSTNRELLPKLTCAEWRTYTWRSFDGTEIEGLLALPRDHANKALPLVVCVHGGPTSTWSWGVHAHPLLLAQGGYAVLLPNPRGSAGRSQEFARANIGDMGGGDLQDILLGIDALVRDGTADDERVAITGGSYGGFMSAWAVTQSDRFAAAIPYSVVTNWLSFHLTANIGPFDRLFMASDPFDASGEYPKRSPVYHAHRCKTPTLILHGEDDLCTPPSQAIEFYNALVEAGCEAELVIYPREGHAWLEREHQIDAWRRTREWLERHLGR